MLCPRARRSPSGRHAPGGTASGPRLGRIAALRIRARALLADAPAAGRHSEPEAAPVEIAALVAHARLVTGLITAADRATRRGAAEWGSGDLNRPLAWTLAQVRARSHPGLSLAGRFDPSRPWVAGEPRPLGRALRLPIYSSGGPPFSPTCTVAVEPSRIVGARRGESIVRVQIPSHREAASLPEATGASPAQSAAGAEPDLDSSLAERVGAGYGGAITAAPVPHGGARFTLDLPAV
jgi:hypothetical protein